MATLVALAEEHVPAVVAACTDWRELAQYGTPYWRPRTAEELRRKIAASAGPSVAAEYHFVITNDDQRLVGECSVHSIDWRNRVAQLGICIWDPADRGLGVGSAALSELIDWARDYLGILRLEAWFVAGNVASRRLFHRHGFITEGLLRSRLLIAGGRWDIEVTGLHIEAEDLVRRVREEGDRG